MSGLIFFTSSPLFLFYNYLFFFSLLYIYLILFKFFPNFLLNFFIASFYLKIMFTFFSSYSGFLYFRLMPSVYFSSSFWVLNVSILCYSILMSSTSIWFKRKVFLFKSRQKVSDVFSGTTHVYSLSYFHFLIRYLLDRVLIIFSRCFAIANL